jgi:hypothetical protein
MAVGADGVGDLGVAAIFLARGLQQRRGGLVRDAAVFASSRSKRRMTATGTSPSKTTRAGAASMPACRQLQGQDLATGDAAGVAHARELADGESAVLVHQRALGPHAAQRRALALQVAQILGRSSPRSTARLA